MSGRDPLFYWRNRTTMKTCTKCTHEIKKSEKFIKITVNGTITYRHDRKCG